MLSLLFNTSFWYDVLVAIVIVLIVIACIKHPSSKWFVATILSIALVVSTCYCAIQLNYYYTASGGIYGKISGIFNTNIVEVEELTFSLKNVELVKEYEDTYSAKVLNNKVVKLNGKDNFTVYVNDEPCTISQVENETNYCIANYSYIFFGEDKSVLCEDTLTFHFAFYTNSTYLSVSTIGGADAVKYWNYYFNKNVFDIRLEKLDKQFDKAITINTGNTSNFDNACFVKFVAVPGFSYSSNGELLTGKEQQTVEVQLLNKGTCATEPTFDLTTYFYETIYEPNTIIVFSTVPGATKPGQELIQKKLVSCTYSLPGFNSQINLSTYKFTENTTIYIYPIYETVK